MVFICHTRVSFCMSYKCRTEAILFFLDMKNEISSYLNCFHVLSTRPLLPCLCPSFPLSPLRRRVWWVWGGKDHSEPVTCRGKHLSLMEGVPKPQCFPVYLEISYLAWPVNNFFQNWVKLKWNKIFMCFWIPVEHISTVLSNMWSLNFWGP